MSNDTQIIVKAILDKSQIKGQLKGLQDEKYLINATLSVQANKREIEAVVDDIQKKTQAISDKNKLQLNIDKSSVKKALKQQGQYYKDLMKVAHDFDTNQNKAFDAKLKQQEQIWKKLEDSRYNQQQRNAQDELKQAKAINKALDAQYKGNQRVLQQKKDLVNLQKSTVGDLGNFEAYLEQTLRPEAVKNYSEQIDSIREGYKNVISEVDPKKAQEGFKAVNAEAKAFKGTMKQLGMEARSFFGEALNNLKKFASWYILGNIFVGILSKVRQVYDNIKDIDSAMTDLYKVTDATDRAYSNFLNTTASKAQEIGATIKDLIDSSADWARLGYSLSDASKLAQNTAIYANVGDMDIETATTSMISTLKGFNMEASQSINIVDKFNEVNYLFLPLCA